MSLEIIITYFQISLAILLVIMIILQKSEAGAGGLFGGGDLEDTSHFKRRGYEKIFFVSTFVVAFLFIASMILPRVIFS